MSDAEMTEKEWLRLKALKKSPPRRPSAGLVLIGLFSLIFGLWWMRYIWSVSGFFALFSPVAGIAVLLPISLGILVLLDWRKKSRWNNA